MKKKILSAILILCLLLSCAACGKSANKDGVTDPAGTAPVIPTIPGNNIVIPEAPPVDPDKLALTVNGMEISAIELNYFYVDAIANFVNQYGQWISYYLDVSKPLSQQYLDDKVTWAEQFLDSAISSAKNIYARYEAAKAAGHSFSKEEADVVAKLYDNMTTYSKNKGHKNVDEYLVKVYGEGSSFESYKAYFEVVLMASSYYNAYNQALLDSYTPEILREFEGEEAYKYNSYTYYTYFLDAKRFADTESLQQAAKELSDASNNTAEKLNTAIAKIEKQIAGDEDEDSGKQYTTAIENKDKMYSSINTILQEWLRDTVRVEGDIGAFPYYVTDSNDSKTLQGYYIVLFQSVKDNQIPLVNVRHILVAFEGGTYDKTTGETTYSETEKTKAKNEAQLIYDKWLSGEKTEATFAELAKQYTDDGNGDVGGIYNDVYPGQMVQTFNDWCFDQSRAVGDHGLVETEYGYHIMFYSGASETTYRDFLSSTDKLAIDMEAWQKALLESAILETIDTSAVNIHYVIYAG